MFFKLRAFFQDKITETSGWGLSSNPNAIDLLRENPHLIDFKEFSQNLNANELLYGDFLEENFNNLYWGRLSANPSTVYLLAKNINKLDRWYLSSNPNAAHLLAKYPHMIDWHALSANPSPVAIEILKKNLNEVYWDQLSLNTGAGAIRMLEENPNKIDWGNFAKNVEAIRILEQNIQKLDPWYISSNPRAIHLLKKHPELIYWIGLCFNPRAASILEENIDKINWYGLSSNISTVHIIENNLDKIDNLWDFSQNPSAVEFLEKHPRLIDWKSIWCNPSIFTYDYNKIKETNNHITEQINMLFLHPMIIAAYINEENEAIEITKNINMYAINNISLIFNVLNPPSQST